MPSETPEVYKSETKKMLSAMEGYIKGAEAIAAEGSTSFVSTRDACAACAIHPPPPLAHGSWFTQPREPLRR